MAIFILVYYYPSEICGPYAQGTYYRNKLEGSGWIAYFRKGEFYTKFSITALGF